MKYVIMADGNMKRWDAGCDTPKHLLKIEDETLLERLVRQIHCTDINCQIIITSHNKQYEIPGAVRYEPQNNYLEIDRFTWEIIEDDICFLYGDTYYIDDVIEQISRTKTDGLHFIGTEKSIIAVIVHDGELFKQHINRVKQYYKLGKITDCKGWQVYQSYAGVSFGHRSMGYAFTLVSDENCDFNTLQEYKDFLSKRK